MNMLDTIKPKSDQINADDLLGGPITIRITSVAGSDNPEQPVNVNYDGDGGKPFKPCKSMRRVMVHVWGPDAAAYVGRSMTLYCDQGVSFGGMKVGGIRVSHMSNMGEPKTMLLTSTKSKRIAFTVAPLVEKAPAPAGAKGVTLRIVARYDAATDMHDIVTIGDDPEVLDARKRLPDKHPHLDAEIADAIKRALDRVEATDEQSEGTGQ